MPAETLERVVREEWGRLIALLLAESRRLDLVEDALADAVEAAARRWPAEGPPSNPQAWLLTAARRRIVDRLRAEAIHRRKAPLLITDAAGEQEVRPAREPTPEEELLQLVILCAHPALTRASASALALRLVLGVTTADIARLFLVPEPTVAARLTRAKKKIITAGIPFGSVGASDLPARLDGVAETAYLAFTAGYAPGSGPDLLRTDLAGEAIRLARVCLRLCPGEPALVALVALMLVQHSRRDARVDAEGHLVVLADQDRSRWHADEIAEARALLAHPALRAPVGALAASYALKAAIGAEHAAAESAAVTRWDRLVALYDQLLRVAPTPAARLARAVAVGEASGPEAGLAAMAGELPANHRTPAVRAELLARAGRPEAARAAFDDALRRCDNAAERDHLERRRAALP